jgi:hypothetical protein
MTEKNPVVPVAGGNGGTEHTNMEMDTVGEGHPLTASSNSIPALIETKPNGPPQEVEIGAENGSLNVEVVTRVAHLSPTALTFQRELTFEEWQDVGVQLHRIDSGVKWWIGDWLRYGERTYGEGYAQGIAQTDLSYQTLANTVWVASKVEFSRRRENLSFRHHAEVASLEPTEQDALLGEAEAREWTSPELRSAVQTYKREKKIAGSISGIDMTDCDLLNEDALAIDEWPKADLIIAVPPIHHNYQRNESVLYQWLSRASDSQPSNLFVIGPSEQILRVAGDLRDYLNVPQTTIVWEKVEDLGFQRGYSEIHELILWGGVNPRETDSQDRTVRSIWKHPPTYEYDYPNDKPQEIIEQLIDLVTLPGEMIVDPFAGCGTVAAAAKKMHRNYWGCEADKEGYDIGQRRIGGSIR